MIPRRPPPALPARAPPVCPPPPRAARPRPPSTCQVLDSDVDLAISTLLTSVLKSQKSAIHKDMTRKFAKYIVNEDDPFGLLLHQLNKLFLDAMEWNSIRGAVGVLEVDADEFEARALDVAHVSDPSAFFASVPFQKYRRKQNASGKDVIIRESDEAAFDAAVAAAA